MSTLINTVNTNKDFEKREQQLNKRAAHSARTNRVHEVLRSLLREEFGTDISKFQFADAGPIHASDVFALYTYTPVSILSPRGRRTGVYAVLGEPSALMGADAPYELVLRWGFVTPLASFGIPISWAFAARKLDRKL